MHIGFHCCSLTLLAHNSIHFLACFSNDILNSSRVDSPVQDQPGQCETCHLTTHRIKTRKDDCFWSIINDQVNSCGCLQRANIAPFTSNNTPFHFIIWQWHNGDNSLRNLVRGTALNSQSDDLSGTRISLFTCFFFNDTNSARSFRTHFVFYTCQ